MSDTLDFLVMCYRHPREDVPSMPRGCYEETVAVEFQLYAAEKQPKLPMARILYRKYYYLYDRHIVRGGGE